MWSLYIADFHLKKWRDENSGHDTEFVWNILFIPSANREVWLKAELPYVPVNLEKSSFWAPVRASGRVSATPRLIQCCKLQRSGN